MLVRLLVIVLIALPRFPGYLSPSAISCVAAKGVSGMAKRRANGEGKAPKTGRPLGGPPPNTPQGRTKPFTEMCWGASRRKPRKWGSTLWGLPSLTSGFMSHNGVLHILRRVLMLLEVCKVRFYNLHRTFVTLTLQSGVDMKTASGILGRYSAGFTLDTYPYVTTAAQKTTEKIINILKS